MTSKILVDGLMGFLGLSSGVIVSAGVFSFINAMGIVPRMAVRTKTKPHLRTYEDAIVLGGLAAALLEMFEMNFHFPLVLIGIFSLATGMFMGMLAVALAEVLNVMPILMKRFRINTGLAYMIVSLGIGKSVGSLIYFLVGGFFER
ncbi:MAG: stage V sporulation protein AB [Bacillota bacterium]